MMNRNRLGRVWLLVVGALALAWRRRWPSRKSFKR